MPRTFINRTDTGTEFKTASEAGGGSKAEKFILGNTDFEGQCNPLTNFNFVLEVEALYFLALKSVKAFNKENEFEYIREGGVNDYIHLKRKPISKPFTFQVERYVGTDRFLDPLALGTELVLPLALYVYRHKAQQGWSAGAWADKMPGRIFLFTGCTVMSKDYGELDAERSGLLTETTTIAYRELIAITNPFDNSEKPEWTFKDGKDEATGFYKTKYAAFAKNDFPGSSFEFKYGQYEDGTKKLVRKSYEGDKDHAEPWSGKDGAKVKRAKQSKPDMVNETYKVEAKDGSATITRKDKSDFNRPQYELKKHKNTNKYAAVSEIDKTSAIYTEYTDKDGVTHMKRDENDKSQVNKPAWDGSKKTDTSWAAKSAPDKADKTYKVETKNGLPSISRKDEGTDFNRPQYELAKDGANKKYATRAYIDDNAAKPIYKEAVDEDGVTHLVRDDDAKINKPAWNGKTGAKTYAQKSAPDKADLTYTVETKDGLSKITRKDKSDFNRPAWDGKKGAQTSYAQQSAPDEAGTTYNVETKNGVSTVKRTDSSDFNRPQYELAKDKANQKYSQVAYADRNAGEKTYDVTNGVVKRTDHSQVNKPAWDGTKGSKPSYAKQSAPDAAGSTYSVSTDKGVSTVKRTDSSDFNRPQYELSKDKSKQKYSQVAYVDQNAGEPIYSVSNGVVKRNDHSPLNKPQYSLKKDRANVRYAQTSPMDAKEALLREQYEVSVDGATPKYAQTSPKDAEKAVPVIWPPTRRAMMADSLKK